MGMEARDREPSNTSSARVPGARGVAQHDLPFTRNVLGVMDYTPVTFTDHKYRARTTNAHELALAVVFETAVQHMADSVQGLPRASARAEDVLKQVPSAWDETRALSGEPGKSVVVARRAEDVVCRRNQRRQGRRSPASTSGSLARAPVDDAHPRRRGRPRLRRGAMTVAAKDGIDVPMRARGGFVMRIQ